MNVPLNENVVRLIILDISNIYAQIHNQGYFNKESVNDILQQYNNQEHWCVLVIE